METRLHPDLHQTEREPSQSGLSGGDIEAALRDAEAAGWTVEEIHRGHRWVLRAAPQGCDDALLTSFAGVQRAVFDREAPSFAAAVASAITAIEASIPGARVVAVERLDSADPTPLPHSA